MTWPQGEFVPNIPEGAEPYIKGCLYTSDNAADLGQDMIEIEDARSGLLISAGWVPEGNPGGAYGIAVTKEFRLLQSTFRTSDFAKACGELQSRVNRWLSSPRNN